MLVQDCLCNTAHTHTHTHTHTNPSLPFRVFTNTHPSHTLLRHLQCIGRLLPRNGQPCDCPTNCEDCWVANGGISNQLPYCTVCRNSRALLNGQCVDDCSVFGPFLTEGTNTTGRRCVLAGIPSVPPLLSQDEFQTAAPTPTTDRRCAAVTASCPTGMFRSALATLTTNITCSPWSQCAVGTFQSSAPTSTTVRVRVVEPRSDMPLVVAAIVLQLYSVSVLARV